MFETPGKRTVEDTTSISESSGVPDLKVTVNFEDLEDCFQGKKIEKEAKKDEFRLQKTNKITGKEKILLYGKLTELEIRRKLCKEDPESSKRGKLFSIWTSEMQTLCPYKSTLEGGYNVTSYHSNCIFYVATDSWIF